MSQRLVVVDAFTAEPFSGNPAAVAILDGDRSDAWLQAVAAEMNLSETAFLRTVSPGVWGLRWFTPTSEVPLCGHATLASAHVLWDDGHTDRETLTFQTRAGDLRMSRSRGLIWLDFPAVPALAIAEPVGLRTALGIDVGPRFVGTTGADVESIPNLLVELASASAVADLVPDLNAITALSYGGVIVTASAGDGTDFVSRYFAPAFGIPEDPVTGSTHCTLAPFWADRLGKDTFVARQLSRRGGELRVELRGDRVLIGGTAVTVARTEMVGAAAG